MSVWVDCVSWGFAKIVTIFVAHFLLLFPFSSFILSFSLSLALSHLFVLVQFYLMCDEIHVTQMEIIWNSVVWLYAKYVKCITITNMKWAAFAAYDNILSRLSEFRWVNGILKWKQLQKNIISTVQNTFNTIDLIVLPKSLGYRY